MAAHASSINKYERVAISNNPTLGSGILHYASTNYKPQEFLDKTTDEVVKRLESLGIPEIKVSGNKSRFEANNEILEEINQAVSSIEKDNVEKCQEMVRNGKKLPLKLQKLIRIADREEDGEEVVKCHTSDDLASNLNNEKQLLRARREAASKEKTRKW